MIKYNKVQNSYKRMNGDLLWIYYQDDLGTINTHARIQRGVRGSHCPPLKNTNLLDSQSKITEPGLGPPLLPCKLICLSDEGGGGGVLNYFFLDLRILPNTVGDRQGTCYEKFPSHQLKQHCTGLAPEGKRKRGGQ